MKKIVVLIVFVFYCFMPAFSIPDIETRLMFYPINKAFSDIRLQLKQKFQDTYFYTNDGIKLNGWYIKADKSKPTIIYCHGQGENISLSQDTVQFLADNGYGVFIFDYRGHGKSEGTPSEEGMYRDLEAAISYLGKHEKIQKTDIVLWGRSLGGAVVVDVASRDDFEAVILESTFTNIRDAGCSIVKTGISDVKSGFWSGISSNFIECFPLRNKFSSDEKIEKIKSPLFIAHSKNDEIIPYQMSQILASKNSRAELYLSDKGSHHSSDWVFEAIKNFLKTI